MNKDHLDEVLSKNIKPEPFTDDYGKVKNEYIGGVYGDQRIKSYYSPKSWKNEWDLIPDDQKKELIDWINSKLKLDDMFYDQSLKLQSTNPITEYLVKDKVLPNIDTEVSNETSEYLPKIPEDTIHYHNEVEPFMEAFIHHNKNSTISMSFHPKRLRLGFVVNDYEEIHFVKLSTLYPIWSPPTQDKLAQIAIENKLKTPQKNDVHVDKIFQTTVSHSLGLHWAGILELNISKMSTVINGIQHALQLPNPRYRIEWVNLKNPRDRTEMLYNSSDITSMITDYDIKETDGYEKAPRIYPETSQIPYRTIWGETK